MMRWFAATLLALCLWTCPALAHETTRSYVKLDRDGTQIDVRMRVAFRDIEVAIWIDEDLDGAITWGEVQRRLDAISDYLGAGFSLDSGGPCALTRSRADVSDSGGIAYLDVYFTGTCPDAVKPLVAKSRLFTEIDPDHRMFLTAQVGGATTTTLLSAANPTVTLSGASGGYLASFVSYFVAGIEHLVGGPDHLAFLLVLILPAICNPGNGRAAFLGVVSAITGFTIAHALTLTAVLSNLLRPPGGLIEVLIALTILVTALDNIRPFIPAPRPAMAAAFGIIHGCGFASALGTLDLDGWGFVVALLGFNLGIEVAQVGLVLLVMPALYYLGAGRRVLWLGSAVAGAASLWWIWQRAGAILALL